MVSVNCRGHITKLKHTQQLAIIIATSIYSYSVYSLDIRFIVRDATLN